MTYRKNSDGRERRPVGAAEESDSTLLPMLIGGLVLVVVGATIVMTFV